MKISIITTCLNSSATILDTILSVKNQNYQNIEHIFVDGCSTDDTLQIINDFAIKNKIVISEPDDGIYDAMNKGIQSATGDIIGFLNSDDTFTTNNSVTEILNKFFAPEIDAVYGDLIYVPRFGPKKPIRQWKSNVFIQDTFSKGWSPPHPTFYARSSIFKKYGVFNTSYRIAADIELMARFFEIHKIYSAYIPKTLVTMKVGGVSNRNIRNILILNIEIILALKKHHLFKGFIRFFYFKLISRFLQFI